jgi:Raf kinase inhibitor-like YbhB/YbcL family protein
MAFSLKSPAFGNGQAIPRKYTGDGEDVSPPLAWSGPPAGAKSFVLVVEDPDAPSGTFRHWGICNLTGTHLPEGASGTAATNDFGERGYRGPAPPRGHGVHHYHFRLFALDVETLAVPPHAKVADLRKAAEGHILGEAELIGTYVR